ncbi:S8 family serine peptidase [Terriglobus aquaticus]|uniref:S8 family serine peptidase n=1 Tax=Terriglobus aquaticus TaxID=940139 RepID=A0ABW9KLL3_9BACT|nr:S8 family serine peptidase [Terriglobus aquaticus]
MMLLVALPVGAQSPDGRPHIAKEADLPRISYPVSGTAQELLQMPKSRFLQFAAPVEADMRKIQAQYQIDDHTTLAAMLEAEVNVLVLRGGHDQEALDLIARIRSLEDKPAEKLTADLGTEVFLRARMAGGGASEACPKAEPALYAKTLQGLPWETVAPAVRELRMRNQVVTPSFLAGMVDAQIGPALARQHALTLGDAQFVIDIRGFLETMAPCKAVVLPVLETYMAAHQTQKPDIWAAREVTLTDADRLTPVPVAIWDSGIDLQLFPGRLYTNPSPGRDEDPHGIAWDVFDDRTHGPLIPLPADIQQQYAEQVRLMEGVGDLQNGTDSPAASALRARLAAMSPAETRAFFDTQAIVGGYAHGTHVTGIAARGNPAIRLAYARMTYDNGNPHQPPSEALSRKSAAAMTESVAWFKAQGIRVVNMSWWDRPSNFEKDLADNGIGKEDTERKAMARHLFGMERDALYAAIQGAPDILFVTIAGNNNVDNAFEECMPSSFVLPNLIVTGAVDQAGEPTGFTSYGDNVAVDANGYAVPSVVPGGATVRDSGTSMAAPQVTNLAAKLLAVDPKLTPPELISLIREGATTSADGKRHLIDPQRSMALLKAKMGVSTQAMMQ